jgi:DNA-binding NarL/FixJ family response regulator
VSPFASTDVPGQSRSRLPRVASTVLTAQELAVLRRVAIGWRNNRIAEDLRRSAKTIEKHRASLCLKLKLTNAAQLAAYAIAENIVTVDDVLSGRLPAERQSDLPRDEA